MSEVLSQGEVDALLRGVGDGEVETVLTSTDFRINMEKVFRNNLENIELMMSRVGRRPRMIFS